MKICIPAGALALALGLGVASCSDTPTAPTMTAPPSADMSRSGPNPRGQTLSFPVAGPMANAAGVVVANFAGTFTVTKFGFNEETRQLLVTGVLNGTATYLDGTTPAASVNRTVTTTATLTKGVTASAQRSNFQLAAASCGILALDLGPLHLDILGLVVDLNQVVLDITAQTGAGNLLGNLLCALTGLLDGAGALAGILNILDAINNLLGAIGGFAAPAAAPAGSGFMAVPAFSA
jgi:hypothetical protein